MPSLKEYRSKISAVKGTQKITSAMKMVSVARLKKAQSQAINARPYALDMEETVSSLSKRCLALDIEGPPLLTGRKSPKTCLFVVIMSDRGLCGGLNVNLARYVKEQTKTHQKQGMKVKFLLVGRKAKALFRKDYSEQIIDNLQDFVVPSPDVEHARVIVNMIIDLFETEEIDRATIFFNEFFNAIQQDQVFLPLIPFAKSVKNMPEGKLLSKDKSSISVDVAGEEKNVKKILSKAVYELEPDEETLLSTLLPKNIVTQVYRALIENYASELAARMTAMDNATRNAEKMIDKLSLEYNRLRQAAITRELIEIVSGAEAL